MVFGDLAANARVPNRKGHQKTLRTNRRNVFAPSPGTLDGSHPPYSKSAVFKELQGTSKKPGRNMSRPGFVILKSSDASVSPRLLQRIVIVTRAMITEAIVETSSYSVDLQVKVERAGCRETLPIEVDPHVFDFA